MSNTAAHATSTGTYDRSYSRRVSTETKASVKTTELIAYLVTVAARRGDHAA